MTPPLLLTPEEEERGEEGLTPNSPSETDHSRRTSSACDGVIRERLLFSEEEEGDDDEEEDEPCAPVRPVAKPCAECDGEDSTMEPRLERSTSGRDLILRI